MEFLKNNKCKKSLLLCVPITKHMKFLVLSRYCLQCLLLYLTIKCIFLKKTTTDFIIYLCLKTEGLYGLFYACFRQFTRLSNYSTGTSKHGNQTWHSGCPHKYTGKAIEICGNMFILLLF